METTFATGLRISQDVDLDIRVGFDDRPDWLGPGRLRAPGEQVELVQGIVAPPGGARVLGSAEGVRLVQDDIDGTVLILRLEATRDLSAASSGGFTDPAVGVRFQPAGREEGSWPDGMRAFGHQYTEFGLPTQAGETLERWFLLPFRPNVVLPLWLCAPDGRTLLLAPLDAFHEQVITVPTRADPTAGITWGWHGDLAEVPAGFSTSLAVLAGDSPRTLLEQWATMLDVAPRLSVDHDTLGGRVSYWTDNGAAYWYRTEPPRSVPETLGDAVTSVEKAGIPVGAVQLDSWFYPHETIRPFDTDEWVVPPSGLVDWVPRDDILPGGIESIRDRIGDRPLVTHSRHLSKTSPLTEQFDCWVDDEYAHPKHDDYYEHLLDRARGWGVETW